MCILLDSDYVAQSALEFSFVKIASPSSCAAYVAAIFLVIVLGGKVPKKKKTCYHIPSGRLYV